MSQSQHADNINVIKAIKVLSKEQHGQLLQLIISIGDTNINHGTSLSSDEYSIYNLINVRFKASLIPKGSYSSYDSRKYYVTYDISIKKDTSAKNMTIFLKIVCDDNQFKEENIVCKEDWCDWISIGEIANACFAVDLEVTLSKPQSIINMKLYNDDTFTDFTLSGEDGSVAVHKAHLAAHSDTFMTMFSNQWKETQERHMVFKGVTRQTLQDFKVYMYLGSIPDNDEDLRALLLFAMQYLVESLKTECSMRLLKIITAENLDSLVEFCTENKLQELLRIIHETTPKSVLAEGYANRIKKQLSSDNVESQEPKAKKQKRRTK